tara:strand:+ start:454 stop:564 length:111 start_codon:yes stop_codon:yes gene_type:complete
MVGMPKNKGKNYNQDAPKNTQIIVARPTTNEVRQID